MIALPKRGALRTLSLEVERELTEEEVLELRNLPANSPPPVKILSIRHRRTAQLVASGMPPSQVAEALGYTPTRVGQLLNDPSFVELVSYYEDQIHEETLEAEKRFQEKLRNAGEQALDLINDRLEGERDIVVISTSELRQIVTMAADRTVAPPKTAVANPPALPQNITLNFGTTLKPKTITPDGVEEKEDEREE